MSSIHYKFRTTLEYKTLEFDGLAISVADCKREICAKENIKAESFDLVLHNAHTKRNYTGDALIPRNSSIIVQRIPRENAEKLPKIQGANSGLVTRGCGGSSSMASEVASHVDSSTFEQLSESQRLEHIKEVSTKAYQSSNFQKRTNTIMSGPPPPTYTCNRCYQPGHWYKNCPMLNIKRTTGIPGDELMETTADDPMAMMTSSGKYVVPIMHWRARNSKKPVSEAEQAAASRTLPAELTCPLCSNLLKEAMLTVCCGDSFCAECVYTKIQESDTRACPGASCKREQLGLDQLVPNLKVRQACEAWAAGGATGGSTPGQDQPPPQQQQQQQAVRIRIGIQAQQRQSSQSPAQVDSVTESTVVVQNQPKIPGMTPSLECVTAPLTLPPAMGIAPQDAQQVASSMSLQGQPGTLQGGPQGTLQATPTPSDTGAPAPSGLPPTLGVLPGENLLEGARASPSQGIPQADGGVLPAGPMAMSISDVAVMQQGVASASGSSLTSTVTLVPTFQPNVPPPPIYSTAVPHPNIVPTTVIHFPIGQGFNPFGVPMTAGGAAAQLFGTVVPQANLKEAYEEYRKSSRRKEREQRERTPKKKRRKRSRTYSSSSSSSSSSGSSSSSSSRERSSRKDDRHRREYDDRGGGYPRRGSYAPRHPRGSWQEGGRGGFHRDGGRPPYGDRRYPPPPHHMMMGQPGVLGGGGMGPMMHPQQGGMAQMQMQQQQPQGGFPPPGVRPSSLLGGTIEPPPNYEGNLPDFLRDDHNQGGHHHHYGGGGYRGGWRGGRGMGQRRYGGDERREYEPRRGYDDQRRERGHRDDHKYDRRPEESSGRYDAEKKTSRGGERGETSRHSRRADSEDRRREEEIEASIKEMEQYERNHHHRRRGSHSTEEEEDDERRRRRGSGDSERGREREKERERRKEKERKRRKEAEREKEKEEKQPPQSAREEEEEKETVEKAPPPTAEELSEADNEEDAVEAGTVKRRKSLEGTTATESGGDEDVKKEEEEDEKPAGRGENREEEDEESGEGRKRSHKKHRKHKKEKKEKKEKRRRSEDREVTDGDRKEGDGDEETEGKEKKHKHKKSKKEKKEKKDKKRERDEEDDEEREGSRKRRRKEKRDGEDEEEDEKEKEEERREKRKRDKDRDRDEAERKENAEARTIPARKEEAAVVKPKSAVPNTESTGDGHREGGEQARKNKSLTKVDVADVFQQPQIVSRKITLHLSK